MKILVGIIGVVVVLIVLGATVPVIWPLATTYSANITSMTGTDTGTLIMVALWPIVLLMVGIGVAIGAVMFALKKFGIMGKGDIG